MTICLGLKNGVLGMAECAVIEYLFEVSLCVCVVVIALVWIFGFQMNGDFWVSSERWLDGCIHFTDLG